MDRSSGSWTFYAFFRSDQGEGIRVGLWDTYIELDLTPSWWEETTHVLKREGEKDKEFTITAVPLMVSCGVISMRSSS